MQVTLKKPPNPDQRFPTRLLGFPSKPILSVVNRFCTRLYGAKIPMGHRKFSNPIFTIFCSLFSFFSLSFFFLSFSLLTLRPHQHIPQ